MRHMIKEEFTAVLSVSEVVISYFEEVWEPNYSLWNMSTHPYDDSQHEHVLKKMLKLKRYIKTIMTNSAPTHYSIFTKLIELFEILDDLYYGDVLDKLMKVNQSRYQPKTAVDEAEFKYKGLITEFADMYLKGEAVSRGSFSRFFSWRLTASLCFYSLFFSSFGFYSFLFFCFRFYPLLFPSLLSHFAYTRTNHIETTS